MYNANNNVQQLLFARYTNFYRDSPIDERQRAQRKTIRHARV